MTDRHLQHLGRVDVDIAIRHSIAHASTNTARSLQTAIGPSEVGQPCARRLAYKLANIAPVSDGGDGWRPTVGTAVHTWLAAMLELANTELGYTRWLIEQRVTVDTDLSGSADAYDTDTGTVLDWKVVGPTSLKKQKSACRDGGKGPGEQYRKQLHLYARGFANAGHDVRNVAIMFLPSSGTLADSVYWSEPYDPTVASTALLRISALRGFIASSPDPGALIGMVPATPESDRMCLYCPFHAYGSNDLAVACPGVNAESTWVASAS